MLSKNVVLVLAALALVGFVGPKANAAVLSDDAQTLGLWHMDTLGTTQDRCGNLRDCIYDDDSANPGRDHHLILGERPGLMGDPFDPTTVPALVPGLYGNALSFDGGDTAYSMNSWDNQDTVRVEFDFMPDTSEFVASTFWNILEVTNAFSLRMETNSGGTYAKLRLFAFDDGGTYSAGSSFKHMSLITGIWQHGIAIVDETGLVSVEWVGATTGGPVTGQVTGLDVRRQL